MKLLIPFFALLSLQAQAQLTCNLPPGTPVIENTVTKWTLSEDGKELQPTAFWKPSLRYMVDSDTTGADGSRVLKGRATMNPELSCAGGCGSWTFELDVAGANNGITPNAKLITRSKYWSEALSQEQDRETSMDFICQ